MNSPYNVYEPSETVEGEFILVAQFDDLEEAESFADNREHATIEFQEGSTSRIIEIEE